MNISMTEKKALAVLSNHFADSIVCPINGGFEIVSEDNFEQRAGVSAGKVTFFNAYGIRQEVPLY